MGLDGLMYRSDSPGPQGELSARGPPPAFPQNHHGNGQRGNPHLQPQVRSVTPPPNWDGNPTTKRFSGNMEYLPRVSPVPQGAWPQDGYSAAAAAAAGPQNQRGISPLPVGRQPIIMQSSAGSKFTFPSGWSQSPQTDYIAGGSRQPPPPYAAAPGSRHSPTDQGGGGGAAPIPPS